MHVLLVDDSKAMRLMVRQTLLQTGLADLQVEEAENGSDALAKLCSVTPDIILSDWNMPEMGGVDLLRELRSRGCAVTFGFVTPEAPTAQMRERASEEGAQFMIAKPFSVQRFRDVLQSAPEDRFAAMRAQTAAWSGRAGIDAVDYRIVRAFRINVIEMTLAPWQDLVAHRFVDFSLPAAQGYEAAVWAMLEARPPHLLDRRHADWQALLLAAAARVDEELGSQPGGLAARSWGERNTSDIHHPLSRALPGFLARRLDMPRQPLPGDSNMPRVQAPTFGASQRFAIAPGREDESYLMMPGGQSPHPLSPFHHAGHADWAEGRPTPLLPGDPRHRLTLVR